MKPTPYRFARECIKKLSHLPWLLLILVGLLPNGFNAQADPLDNWHWLYPTATANTINAICAGGGGFVAVGAYGTILSSPDGKTWSHVDSGTLATLWGVAFGNGRFVAVGDGTILASSNSLDWTASASGLLAGNDMEGITFGSGIFVGFSSDTIFISTNGQDWASNAPGFEMESVVYGQGVFEASGAGTNTSEFFESSDGIHWTAANEQSISSGLIYGGLLFFANGYFATSTANVVSTDGLNWSSQDYPSINTMLAFVDGEFIIPSTGYTYTSANFSRWTTHPSNLIAGGPGAWNPGAYAAGMFVTYGQITSDYSPSPLHLLYSTNGMNWFAGDSDDRNDLYAVTSYNGAIIAAGAGGLFLESTNGQTWTEYGYGAPVPPGDNIIFDITVGNSNLVAADFVNGGQLVALNSTNGGNWTSGVVDSQSVYGAKPGIAFGNGTFVAWDGLIETSSDGLLWQAGTPSEAYIVDVAFGNGLFVGVGYSSSAGYPGQIVTSTDGIDWRAQNAESPDGLLAVVYGAGQWIALGPSGTISTSPDGTNWATSVFGGPSITGLTRLIFYNGVYVALLEVPEGGYAVATSVDGFTWTNHILPTDLVMNGMSFVDNSLVVVGRNGAILRSDPFPSAPITLGGQAVLTSSGFQFTAAGVAGRPIVIQGSTNLTDWVTLTNLVPSTESVQFVDSSSTNFSQKFYRVLAQ